MSLCRRHFANTRSARSLRRIWEEVSRELRFWSFVRNFWRERYLATNPNMSKTSVKRSVPDKSVYQYRTYAIELCRRFSTSCSSK